MAVTLFIAAVGVCVIPCGGLTPFVAQVALVVCLQIARRAAAGLAGAGTGAGTGAGLCRDGLRDVLPQLQRSRKLPALVFALVGQLFEDDLLHAVGGGVLADDGDGLRHALPGRSEDRPERCVSLVLGLRGRVVDDQLDVDLGVLVARCLFRLSGAALDLLLVHLRGLNDLDAFDETGEDDAVELDQLVFYIDHSVLLPYAGAGTASSSSPGSPSSLAAA